MNVSTTANATTKLLRATPETVHWGYLDATIKPALTIDSGERVTIECATCNPEWMPAKDSGFDILPDITEIHQKVKKGLRQSHLHRAGLRPWRRGGRRARGQNPGHQAPAELGMERLPRLHGDDPGRLSLHAADARPARSKGERRDHGVGLQDPDGAVLRPACGGAGRGVRAAEQQGAARIRRQSRLQGIDRGQHDLSSGLE